MTDKTTAEVPAVTLKRFYLAVAARPSTPEGETMAKKKPEPAAPWNERLDAAVMGRWPEVACETYYNLLSMQFVTRWRQAGTDEKKLKPALARQVLAFVAGFMASEDSRNG